MRFKFGYYYLGNVETPDRSKALSFNISVASFSSGYSIKSEDKDSVLFEFYKRPFLFKILLTSSIESLVKIASISMFNPF